MSLLVLDRICLRFGRKVIATDLGLRIGERDRIGLIGPNGSGKTTILRVLVGEQSADSGVVQRNRGIRTGYLPQDISIEGNRPLVDFVLSSVPGRGEFQRELAATEDELAALEGSPAGEETEAAMMAVASRIAEIHEHLNHSERFYTRHEALRIVSGLGFRPADRRRSLSEFSGGWKMRAMLASLLFQQPDLLLLDEPTNHLDMPSVAWLAEFLRRYQRAFVLISHDREFLNEQVSRIVSFEPEGVRQYRGDYEHYVAQRTAEEALLENKVRNIERERARLKRFVDRFRAQANKARAVQSRVKTLEKMEDVTTLRRRKVLHFSFPATTRTVKEIVRVESLAKRFGALVVFPGVDLCVTRGEKIAIIGANGVGKTTLLKIIAGELAPDGGTVKIGSGVNVGYYAQHHAETLHPALTVYEEVAQANTGASAERVRSILGAFLFGGDEVEKNVRVLSGGERARVALSRLLINPGSLLLMDEPTNHLDLESSESLAKSLSTYDGTLIFVSHNRSLVRQLATKIWNIENGRVETYPGTLDEYMYSCRLRLEMEATAGDGDGASGVPAPDAAVKPVKGARPEPRGRRDDERARKRREAQARERRKKRVGPIEARISELETRVSRLEAREAECGAQLADPAIYGDEVRRNELLNEYRQVTAKLKELTARWEAALEELDRVEAELTART